LLSSWKFWTTDVFRYIFHINDQIYANPGCEGQIQDPAAKELFDQLYDSTDSDKMESRIEDNRVKYAMFTDGLSMFEKPSYVYYVQSPEYCDNELFTCQEKVDLGDGFYR
jgi:hypothetical protein